MLCVHKKVSPFLLCILHREHTHKILEMQLSKTFRKKVASTLNMSTFSLSFLETIKYNSYLNSICVVLGIMHNLEMV